MAMMKRFFSAAALLILAVTLLSAHPAPRPPRRPAPVRAFAPELFIPGLLFSGFTVGTAIIAATAAEAEAHRAEPPEPTYQPVQVAPAQTNAVVVSSPAAAGAADPTAVRTFVTKIAVLKADGKTVYYDSLFKRPVRYAGDIVYLSTIAVDDVQLSYSAIQNVSYAPYR